MQIALASDHAGLTLKDQLRDWLSSAGYEVQDLGTHTSDPVDYPDQAALVARRVILGEVDRGIVVCGSGAGAAIAANKLAGIRCASVSDTYTAHQCVEHDDVNVLSLGGRTLGFEVAREIVSAFLSAKFSGEARHQVRLEKIRQLESAGK